MSTAVMILLLGRTDINRYCNWFPIVSQTIVTYCNSSVGSVLVNY